MPLTAGLVMNSAAALLNDVFKTDFTYAIQTPYLNMAISELTESLEESNVPITNEVSVIYPIPVGTNKLSNLDTITEIQELGERTAGRTDAFVPLPRKELVESYPVSSSLLFWAWYGKEVRFNTNGANTPIEVQIKHIKHAFIPVADENSVIGSPEAHTYLSYKTAALCALFIGENPTRAAILDAQAERALERIITISNKGKQQIMTRHRPFRASYKIGGGY